MTTEEDGRAPTTRESAAAWQALLRAQNTLMRRFERAGDFTPLRPREYDVLFVLSTAPERTLRLRELNERVFLSQPSLSRMVERLAAQGLVDRLPAPDDGRGVLVRLTDAGAELQRRVGRAHVRSIRRYVGGALSREELATLEALTTKLTAAQRHIPADDGPAVR